MFPDVSCEETNFPAYFQHFYVSFQKSHFLSLPSLGLSAKTPLFHKGFLLLDNFFDVWGPNFLSYKTMIF